MVLDIMNIYRVSGNKVPILIVIPTKNSIKRGTFFPDALYSFLEVEEG